MEGCVVIEHRNPTAGSFLPSKILHRGWSKPARLPACLPHLMPKKLPRIAAVRAWIQEDSLPGGESFPPRNSVEAEEKTTGGIHGLGRWIDGVAPWPPICNPMSVYDQYNGPRSTWGIGVHGLVVCEVVAEDGAYGCGITTGGEAACWIIERHLSRFVEGQDPRDIELMWDQMWRASMPYGRKGIAVHALSAVDLALWDLLGKLQGEPVYNLLGGKTKAVVPVYCTTARPDLAKELGFVGAKYPLAYAPADGDLGLRKNVETHQKWRDAVGEDFPLMLDCYMSLTVPYAINLAHKLAPIGLKWMEEYLQPDDYAGHAAVQQATQSLPVMLATAEHEYSRWGYKQLIDARMVDVLQPDITWLGGITEARRVVAMASAAGIAVIPHGSSVFSYHLALASPCVMHTLPVCSLSLCWLVRFSLPNHSANTATATDTGQSRCLSLSPLRSTRSSRTSAACLKASRCPRTVA
eukprot:COSAG05_NODE_1807_length_4044_cov_3.445881_1_plen_466_part_00